MKFRIATLALALSPLLAGHALAMTKAEYKATEDRIALDLKANKARCDVLAGNTKDICQAEAKGIEKVAKAELEARYKPSAKADFDVREARADALYDIAKEKCDDLAGNTKDVCEKDAKAAHVRALADAKVSKADADSADLRVEKLADAQKSAVGDKLSADFSAAKERCNALSGATKDSCIADAKVRFGMR